MYSLHCHVTLKVQIESQCKELRLPPEGASQPPLNVYGNIRQVSLTNTHTERKWWITVKMWVGCVCGPVTAAHICLLGPGSPSQASYENITMADTSCGLNIFHGGRGGGKTKLFKMQSDGEGSPTVLLPALTLKGYFTGRRHVRTTNIYILALKQSNNCIYSPPPPLQSNHLTNKPFW